MSHTECLPQGLNTAYCRIIRRNPDKQQVTGPNALLNFGRTGQGEEHDHREKNLFHKVSVKYNRLINNHLHKTGRSKQSTLFYITIRESALSCYIIPPAGMAGAAGSFSGMSTIPHSVVRNMPATEAAFSRATRATFVGSITPAS